MDVDDAPPRRLQVTATGCQLLKDAPHQSLGLTYWFEAAPEGDPYPVSVRFTGTRTTTPTTASEPSQNDTFDVVRSIGGVVPGSGLVAVTFRILDLAPGEWRVHATPVPTAPADAASREIPLDRPAELAPSTASGATSYGPLIGAKAPGAVLGAWPTLVGLGAAVGLIVQALLAQNQHLPATRLLIISLVACLLGLFGAKFYYLASHRAEKATRTFSGMCIQGFVLASIATMMIGALTAAVPVGRMLDVTAPGLLFGMAIGRLGCFFGGCCAGRPTAARWAIWSSDRTLGARRIPVQLVESAMSAVLGAGALLSVLYATPNVGGAVFVAAVAANTVGRQLLFPLRNVPRATSYGRITTMTLAAIAAIAAIAVAVLG